MLVWINGPFGGGKTQVAHEIRSRLPGSVICDPEQVGFGLHRMTPRTLRSDFQDLPAWRHGVFEVLDLVLTRHDGIVLAPMTVDEPAYLDETVGRLRRRGHDVRHVSLLADRGTVLRRLRRRGLGRAVEIVAGPAAALRRQPFALGRLDRCLGRLRMPEFAEQVWTDDLTIPEVAERVCAAVGLDLARDRVLRGRLRRAWTELRSVRFG